jgi:hypothetical protein
VIHALPPASLASSATSSTISGAISEPLTWAQICERYPDEWVCLAETDWIDEDVLFSFRTARVVGHGKTSDEPFEQAEPWWAIYPEICHFFTGEAPKVPPCDWTVVANDQFQP